MNRKWNAKRPEIPIDDQGNWQSYAHKYSNNQRWEVIAHPFFATLEIVRLETGRSSKTIVLKDGYGRVYPMFVADFVNGVKNGEFEVSGGRLVAFWTAVKRGANYGIRAVKNV